MEKDKVLQELLEKGAEKASPDFTESVMKSVHAVAAKPFLYQPLVPASIERIFMICFCTVIALIVSLGLMIMLSTIPFVQSLRIPVLSANACQHIITGIVIFWTIYFVKSIVQRSGRQMLSHGVG